MNEDQPDLFPEHSPPPHHPVSWDDVWGRAPDQTAPGSGSNALVVRPEPNGSSEPDLEVSLSAPTFEASQPEPERGVEEILPANLFGEAEAVEDPSSTPRPVDVFAEPAEAMFRQLLHAEDPDQPSPEPHGQSYALPDVWTFSSGRRGR